MHVSMSPPLARPRPAWPAVSAVVGSLLVPVALLVPLLAAGLQSIVYGQFSTELFGISDEWPRLGLLGLVVTLVPLALIILALCKRWLAWRTLGAGLLLTAVACTWLAWDERPGPRPVVDQLWPTAPGDEHSYAVLMRYAKASPSPEAKAFAAAKFSKWLPTTPADPARWREFVLAQRAAIEADWEQ